MAQSNGADHQAELEERLARYINGDRHALDYDTDELDELRRQQQPPPPPPASALTPRQQQVQQKLWDDWFLRKFNEAIRPFAEGLGKRVGTLHNELVKDIDDNLEAAEKENDKSVQAHNDLVADINEIEKKGTEAHNRLVDSVGKIRDSVKADMIEAIRRLDRNFITEVAELRAKTLVNLSEDISVMKNDVIAVVRANVIDEVSGAVLEEARKEFNKDRQIFAEEMRTKTLASIGEHLTAAKDNMVVAMRVSVVSEISKMKMAAVKDIRKDLNAAVAEKFQKIRGVIKRYVSWLSNRDRQFLVDEVRSTLKDELLNEVREELAAEFIARMETVRAEVRTETRSEMANSIKILRGFLKNRK